MKETHIYKQKVKLKETITFSYFYLVQFLKNVLKRSFKIYWSSKTLKLLKESVEDFSTHLENIFQAEQQKY
jgi:hypothetical protein